MGLVALLMITVVIEITLVGTIRHARSQALEYDQLRADLAQGTAPVGQTDTFGAVLEPGRPIALLSIPTLGLREVVAEGTSSGILDAGPGHRRDTPFPGQPGVSLILGRQAAYGGPFGRVGELAVGDGISVTTGQGVQRFHVSAIRHAGDQTKPLAQGAARLTLVTASGPPYLPDEVVRVDADLESEVQPAPAMVYGAAALRPAESVMQGDPSAALGLFLWAEALLVVSVALVVMRSIWGRWQCWVVAVPVLALCGLQVAHQGAMLLPNVM